MRTSRPRLFALVSAPLILFAGCGGLAPAGESVDQTFARARARAGSDEILVVAWPLSARKALESELGRSPVAVSVAETGELSLQTDCRLDGRYAYHGVTAAESTIRISQTEGMGAGLPTLGGVQVAAGASRDGQGRLHRVQVGRFALDVGLGLALPETPACVGVTHVVESADVGAFTMSGQEARSAGGGVSAGPMSQSPVIRKWTSST